MVFGFTESALSEGGGAYERTTIGEDVSPHGVRGGGMIARGVNGGEGREERPVPPMMAIGIGSRRTVLSGSII